MTNIENSSKIVPEKIGNTNQSSPAKHYCFTLNNYTEDDITSILECFSSKVLSYVFQEETGTNGTKHLQGYVEFKDKCRPLNLINKRIHWEKTRNIKASIDYCQKEDTRSGRIWMNIKSIRKHKHINIELREWQTKLINVFKDEPDDRTIYWIYDPQGCGGKTTFAKYMIQNYPNDVTYISATKSADILTSVNDTSKLFIIDIPRCSEFSPYNALEQIKNGLVCDSKLKKVTRSLMFDPPHVFVMSNHMYDRTKISLDRIHLIDIAEGEDSPLSSAEQTKLTPPFTV